jgi:flavin reductase (DIM6/NTAB) family NADH-FMN oxidoreductase RutF
VSYDGVIVGSGSAGWVTARRLVDSGARVHVECAVVEEAFGGTHTIFIAEVRRAERFEGVPLLYYRGQLGWESMPTGTG